MEEIPATTRSEAWRERQAKGTGAARRYCTYLANVGCSEPEASPLAGRNRGPWAERQPFIKARNPPRSPRLMLQGSGRCGWDGGMAGIAGCLNTATPGPVRLCTVHTDWQLDACESMLAMRLSDERNDVAASLLWCGWAETRQSSVLPRLGGMQIASVLECCRTSGPRRHCPAEQAANGNLPWERERRGYP
jgi:hypothetical protein